MSEAMYIMPLFAIILHNLEEALWLPEWSKYAKKFHQKVNPKEFHFAVLMITVFALIFSAGIILNPDNKIVKLFYFGFFGMMILNTLFPHLISTIVLKKYAPGTITGLLLNIPINSIIIIRAIKNNIISTTEVVISTLVIGGIILLILPILFKLGSVLFNYDEK